jgi:hypothetical protein
MRRTLFTLALGLMLVAIGIGIIRAGAQEGAFESGALGPTRSEIEAEFGRIENPITVPGHPIYNEVFAYELGDATLYVTYRDFNGELNAVYAEFEWAGDGVDEPAARRRL